MSYPKSKQFHAIEEVMDIAMLFQSIAKDGRIEAHEQEAFDDAVKHHSMTLKEIDLATKRTAYLLRTANADSPWHNRLERQLARSAGTLQAR